MQIEADVTCGDWIRPRLAQFGGSVGSVANSYINENTGEASLYNQVAAPCVNGGWQAHAEVLVVFPPGVTPPSIYDFQNQHRLRMALAPSTVPPKAVPSGKSLGSPSRIGGLTLVLMLMRVVRTGSWNNSFPR